MTLPTADEAKWHVAALETVFENLGDGVLVLDHELTILRANQWIERRYSGSGSVAGQKCYTALYGRQDACPACPSVRALRTGKPQTQSAKISAGQGRLLWFELSAYPLPSASDGVECVVEQIKDVTKLKQTEDRLHDQTALHHIFMDESRDGIVVLDPKGQVLEANQQFARMLGLTVEELRQARVWEWDSQWDKDRLLGMLERAEVAPETFQMRFQRKDAAPLYVEMTTAGVTIGDEKLVYLTCRDMTDKKALEEKVRDLGIHDPLTHLYNRRYVLDRLAETAAEYQRGGSEFCISILDLDNFGTINNVHGPRAADQALEALAQSLTATVRPYDIVGRFGGDEFIIVSNNANQIEAEAMIRRIFSGIRGRDLSFEGHLMRVTFSCGLAYCGDLPVDAFSVDAMIARAYEHLRDAKAVGGDRCVSALSPEAGAANTAQ